MKALIFEGLKKTIIEYVESVGSVLYIDLTRIIAERTDIGPANVESAVKHLVDFGKLEGVSGEDEFGWKYIRLPGEDDVWWPRGCGGMPLRPEAFFICGIL